MDSTYYKRYDYTKNFYQMYKSIVKDTISCGGSMVDMSTELPSNQSIRKLSNEDWDNSQSRISILHNEKARCPYK